MSQFIFQDQDGFQVRENQFPMPEGTWNLDPQTKRAVTICNLFVNHHYGIWTLFACSMKTVVMLSLCYLNRASSEIAEGDRRNRRMEGKTETSCQPESDSENSLKNGTEMIPTLRSIFPSRNIMMGCASSLLLSDDHPGNLVVRRIRNDLLGFQQVLPFH